MVYITDTLYIYIYIYIVSVIYTLVALCVCGVCVFKKVKDYDQCWNLEQVGAWSYSAPNSSIYITLAWPEVVVSLLLQAPTWKWNATLH